MKSRSIFVLSTSLVFLLMAGCGGLNPAPTPTQPATQTPPTAQVVPATGVQYHFVTKELLLPTTSAQAQSFALNVDGNSQNHLENKFGEMLALLTSAVPGMDLQSSVDQALKSGQLVMLHVVKASDLMNDPNVSWIVAKGKQTSSAPSFDGSDKFTLDSTISPASPILGAIANGHFTGGPGTTRIQMILLSQSIEVDLIGVRLEADLSAKGCTNGKLGGGVTVDEFQSKLLPLVVEGLNQIVKVDKDAAPTILQALDSNHDGTISVQELENNPLLMSAISPDLDLLDASGKFNPGQDGVKDSFSIGLGFTCVPAAFTAPGD